MGIQDLQAFLESDKAPGACVPVDLLRISRNCNSGRATQHGGGKRGGGGKHGGGNGSAAQQQYAPAGLSLVVDGECCLDRLYGGYFSDWVCGGQWNRMVQFLAVFIQTVQSSNIELSFFLNGAVESQRMAEWVREQLVAREQINSVLRHVNIKGTPPPKIWWTPPVCLRTCLRMALRHLNVGLMCTMDDHRQEVIAFCRENNCDGLMGDDAEYAVFDPPRYFSSKQIKLTYKGSLETKEFVMTEAAKLLGVGGDRMCVLASLLGNYLLPASQLSDVYCRLGLKEPHSKVAPEQLVKALCNYVKSLPSVDNLDSVSEQVFGSATDKRAARFQQSVKYYLNGTKQGFLNYKPQHSARRSEKGAAAPKASAAKPSAAKKETEEAPLDYSRLASETEESQQESLAAYKEATANNALLTPQIVIDAAAAPTATSPAAAPAAAKMLNGGGGANHLLSSSSSSSSSSTPTPSRLTPDVFNGQAKLAEEDEDEEKAKPAWLQNVAHEVLRTACERHEKGLMSPLIYQLFTQGEVKFPVVMEDDSHREVPNINQLFRPIRQLVYAVLFNVHHQKYLAAKGGNAANAGRGNGNAAAKGNGSGAPGGAKTNGTSAREGGKGGSDADSSAAAPAAPTTPRPGKYTSPVKVREWVWSARNPYAAADLVEPTPLDWGVPTIQRLWFGASQDDKCRRFRAFLSCMRSDTDLMKNTAYVPQHLLVMATVLRFIMTCTNSKLQILRKQELDTFIFQAMCPELMNAHYMQELQLPVVTSRGIQLAAMFMAGVDNALLANDACGAPVPWLMCCPWLYFDGKLFHHQLARVAVSKNLMELCDMRIELVVKIERMRKAIMEGVQYQFAGPGLPPVAVFSGPQSYYVTLGRRLRMPPVRGVIVPMRHGGLPPAALGSQPLPASLGGGRLGGGLSYGGYHPGVSAARGGLVRRGGGVPARGGQLEIAGVVVGQWGANYGSRGGGGGGQAHRNQPARHHGGQQPPPQVTSVGGLKNYRGPMSHHHAPHNAFNGGGGGRPSFGVGRGHNNNNVGGGRGAGKRVVKDGGGKKKQRVAKEAKGRGLTIESGNGVVPVAALSLIPTPMKSDEPSYTQQLAAMSGQFDDAINLSSIAASLGCLTADPAAPAALNGEMGQGDGPAAAAMQ